MISYSYLNDLTLKSRLFVIYFGTLRSLFVMQQENSLNSLGMNRFWKTKRDFTDIAGTSESLGSFDECHSDSRHSSMVFPSRLQRQNYVMQYNFDIYVLQGKSFCSLEPKFARSVHTADFKDTGHYYNLMTNLAALFPPAHRCLLESAFPLKTTMTEQLAKPERLSCETDPFNTIHQNLGQ